MSKSRKKAVVSCFRMTPLYNMPPHKVINVLIKAYNAHWLQSEERDFADELISALTRPRNAQIMEASSGVVDDNEPKKLSDPLFQIIQGKKISKSHPLGPPPSKRPIRKFKAEQSRFYSYLRKTRK